MQSKKKSRPIVSRIKLNPEQAVLECCDLNSGKARSQGGTSCKTFPSACAILSNAIVT